MKNITQGLDLLSKRVTAPIERFRAEAAFAEKFARVSGREDWLPLIRQAVSHAEKADAGNAARRIEQAEDMLSPIGAAAKQHTIHLLGHAHIDMNWTWSTLETVTDCHDTFATALRLMEEYPDWVFAQSQVSVYKYIAEYYPELTEPIKERIREGRWEVTAACWTEIDDNLISGESYCRNLLYSKRWMREHYGVPFEDISIDWKADTFGHAWTLPGLMLEGGVTEFYHMRPGGQRWLARWQSPDGSEVLEFDDGKGCYVSPVTPAMADVMLDYLQETGLRDFLFVFGVGDHGGGPTRRHLDAALDMMTWPVFPTIRFSSSREYFDRIRASRDRIPVHRDEINFIFRGCYTSQSKVKRVNRAAENLIPEAEAVCALLGGTAGIAYPHSGFHRAWEHTMYNQFHDILAGSSEHAAMEDADCRFRETEALAGTARHRVLRNVAALLDTRSAFGDLPWDQKGVEAGFGEVRLPGRLSSHGGSSSVSDIFMVFNPTPRPVTGTVFTKLWNKALDPSRLTARDSGGSETPVQVTGSSQYVEHTGINAAFTAREVPPFGWKTYCIYEAEEPVTSSPEYHPNLFSFLPAAGSSTGVRQTGPFAMENDFVSIEIDPSTGGLTHYTDKKTGRDLVPPGKVLGYLEMACEVPHFMTGWFTAQEVTAEPVTGGRLVDDNDPAQSFDADVLSMVSSRRAPMRGPVIGSIRTIRAVGGSRVITEVILHADSGAVDFRIEARWRETGDGEKGVPVLKLVFPMGAEDSRAVYEIPNGCMERPRSREDVPALRWVDVGDDREGFTLLNDSKSGFSVYDGVLRAALIRSSYDPDPLPETGSHAMSFRLIPRGAFDPQAACSAAEEFCKPLSPVPAGMRSGPLACEHSEAKLLEGTVQIGAVKRAEEGDSIVIRLWETSGKDSRIRLWVNGAERWRFCNTLEEDTGAAADAPEGVISAVIPAFATRTIKVYRKGQG
ncbi:MAG: alpha-mannosidase [Abditibacteriota bacterium]|nr:alpha-mannosidase [Abditibacteriota bacterium]